MKNKSNLDLSFLSKKAVKHILAIAFMYILVILYFSAFFFDNKNLPQGDQISTIGATEEVRNYKKETGQYSEWTNSMFGGMPTTALYSQPSFNIYHKFLKLSQGGLQYEHAGIVFAYLIGFYIFMMCFRAKPLTCLLGAVAFTFASYNLIIIEAGHIIKGYAMAFVAPMIGGIILTFRKNYLIGAIVTMVFLGIEIACCHIQITYYAFLTVVTIVLCFFFYYWRVEKDLKSFGKAISYLAVAAVLAILPNTANLVPNYVYSKDTMRGGSELTISPNSKEEILENTNKKGLDKDYAFAWSYGKMESFTLLIPNIYGGGSTILDTKDDAKTIKKLRQNGYGSTYLPTYWGEQPFTSGPVYVGAVVCFLFVLGLFLIKGPEKWWVVAACVISLVLSWGKNFDFVNGFLFEYLPFYDKFRTPSMSLVIAGTAMPILGMMAVIKVFKKEEKEDNELCNALKKSLYVTAGLCIAIMAAAFLFFDFSGSGDVGFRNQLLNAGFGEQGANNIMNILVDFRESMFYKDAFRSLAFIVLSFGLLWSFVKGYLKNITVVTIILISFTLFDCWTIAKRYLNNSDFIANNKVENYHKPTKADLQILKDKDINYRVLNLTQNTFNESGTSYFHKSIGGYSPVKLRRYQDIIEFYMSGQFNMNIINMLNTKYFILPNRQTGEPTVQQNPDAFGNAWFVNSVEFVDNPDEEILAIADKNLKDTAVVDKRYTSMIDGVDFKRDSASSIINTVCNPNHLVYKTSTKKDQLAVFSEVFYDKGGWIAYIDGKEAPHFRSNYILRTMIVPAGEHEIEFKYVPHVRILSCNIAKVSSIAVILLTLGLVALFFYKRKKSNETC